MAAINMTVRSRWTEDELEVGLGPPPDRINYLPWGTRSLKLAVNGDYKGLIRICPEPRSADPEMIVSHAHQSEDIQLSWGGGWEQGIELDYQADTTPFVYFNVTHGGEAAAEFYNVDIVARDRSGVELSRLPVSLTRPPMPESVLVPAWRQVSDEVAELSLQPSTADRPAEAPLYLSRWWPGAWVDYASRQASGPLPRINLLCRRNVGGGYSQIEVFGQADGQSQPAPLATIDGDIQFPLVDLRQISAELYFKAGYWWLRIWFWWLDKGVAERLDPALTPEEKQVAADWAATQEIPDGERVDLVFDKDLRLSHLCSDVHWHELWAPFDRLGPVRVSIAGRKRHEVLIRGGQGWKVVLTSQTRRYLPAPADQVFDPSERVVEQLLDPARRELGAGELVHKHTPYFHDVQFDADLASSDVRHG